MQRIVYISTAREVLDDINLRDILRTSRRNNALAGVTGMLVVGGRRFLQALEGPDDAVSQVFLRIERDPRHFAVVTLSQKTVETRLFGQWAMAYQAASATSDNGQSLPQIVGRLVSSIDDPVVRAEFIQFAALHAAA